MGFGVLFLLLWVGIYVWRWVLKEKNPLNSDGIWSHTHTGSQPPFSLCSFQSLNQENNTFQWNQYHHTTAETGFNWTALTIIWAHEDYRCLFTSKGGFVQTCWLAMLLLLRSRAFFPELFAALVKKSLLKMIMKVHCDVTSGSNHIIQLLRHQRLFMVCFTSSTLTPQSLINL